MLIDMHTHALSESWLHVLATRGTSDFLVTHGPAGPVISQGGSVHLRTNPAMFDYEVRIADMKRAGIDLSIVSLTAPNVYWGDEATSVAASRAINDDMAGAQLAYPNQIRFFASLPLEYPVRAIEELDRAMSLGAVGICTLCNLRGRELVEASLDPIWSEINRRKLPVFVHPTNPPGMAAMNIRSLRAALGFTFDTALAFSKMIVTGFLDRFPDIKFIACHGGGVLPYLAGRLDLFELRLAEQDRAIQGKPSDYLRSLYYDAVSFDPESLALLLAVADPGRVMFGTDYPHPTDVPRLKQQVESLNTSRRVAISSKNAEALFGL